MTATESAISIDGILNAFTIMNISVDRENTFIKYMKPTTILLPLEGAKRWLVFLNLSRHVLK